MFQRSVSVARSRTAAAVTLRTRFLHTDSEVQSGAQPLPAAAAAQPLVDTFGRRHNYLRISLTEKCNLRCTYCMPAGGVALSARAQLLAPAELVALVRVFAALGVDKLRLTGGEPTLRKDLPDLIQELKSIPGIRTVGMTSNGVALARRLPALRRAGLDALNLSLDTLQPARWERLTRRPAALLPRVLAAADTALQLGYTLKLNTVLVRGLNDDELTDFVELARDRDCEVRFIEFMPFSGNEWARDGLLPAREALRRLAAHYELTPAPPRPNDTARMWQAAGLRGRVGFISSMTQHFCGSCNRLRLTADGSLKVCLFGAAEVSLRDALRAGATPDQLAGQVRAALQAKKKQHAGARQRQGVCGRRACSTLAHVDRMVDVGGKPGIARAAAAATLHVGGGRRACSTLAHVDRMVDVGGKPASARAAAAATLHVGGGRRACSTLAHVDRMVDVGGKPASARAAAAATLHVGGGRRACSTLAHVDRMVDVGGKPASARAAAAATLHVGGGRRACSTLAHVDREGRARMVDVGGKPGSARAAAAATLHVGGGRRACSTLSHVDREGRARMVDVGGKPGSARAAAAAATLHVGDAALQLLRDNALGKGDALTVAEIAGVLAAKRTAELIPLCHPLALDAVRVRLTLPARGGGNAVRVACEVRCSGRTGAEMEALVGAALAALTLYDMCKSADRHMRLTDLRVTHKAGGKADFTLEPPTATD